MLEEQSRNQRTSGNQRVAGTPPLAARPHLPLGPATRRSPGGALQLRATACRSTRHQVPPAGVPALRACANCNRDQGRPLCFTMCPLPRPHEASACSGVSPPEVRVVGISPEQSALRRKALKRHVWSVSSLYLPSQKPGTSLSAALPDPPRSCRSAAPASKRAAVPSTPGPSRLQTGVRYLGEESSSRGTLPPRTSPRQSRRQSPREGIVHRGGGRSVSGDAWVAIMSGDARDGCCLRANRTDVAFG